MRFPIFTTRLLAALGAAASLALPSLVGAQSYPSYAVAPQQTIKGTITGFNGGYTVYVQDEKGYNDNISLHDGTVINPTGIKLQEGMHVTIYGYPQGSVFAAYRVDAPVPDYGYGGSGYGGGGYGGGYGYGGYPGGYGGYGGYGYGGYGYPYGYGYPWAPLWGVGFGWFGGFPFYGGYGGFGYNPVIIRGPGFFHGGGGNGGVHGGVSAPVHGGVGAPVRGGGMGAPGRGAPVSAPRGGGGGGGGFHGGGGGGGMHGGPPR